MNIFRKRRGQAAMEFIMSYGWALLAFIIVLSAVTYLGVSQTERFVSDSCSMMSGLKCRDFNLVPFVNETNQSTLQIVVRNELGFDISNISITINGTCDATTNLTGEIGTGALLNTGSGTYGFGCQNLEGMYVEEKITFEFTNTGTGQTHRKVGHIIKNP